jgi:hypothetical protein
MFYNNKSEIKRYNLSDDIQLLSCLINVFQPKKSLIFEGRIRGLIRTRSSDLRTRNLEEPEGAYLKTNCRTLTCFIMNCYLISLYCDIYCKETILWDGLFSLQYWCSIRHKDLLARLPFK